MCTKQLTGEEKIPVCFSQSFLVSMNNSERLQCTSTIKPMQKICVFIACVHQSHQHACKWCGWLWASKWGFLIHKGRDGQVGRYNTHASTESAIPNSPVPLHCTQHCTFTRSSSIFMLWGVFLPFESWRTESSGTERACLWSMACVLSSARCFPLRLWFCHLRPWLRWATSYSWWE